jgi:hypothetical protein
MNMSLGPDIEKLIRDTKRYEFSDGLRDLQLGLTLLFLGIVEWLIFQPGWIRWWLAMKDRFARWGAYAAVLPFVLLLLFLLGTLRVMDALRRRWLWRRSGMVKASTWGLVPTRFQVIAAIISILGIALGIVAQPHLKTDNLFILRLIFSSSGLSFGITLVGLGIHIRIPRYTWLGMIGGLVSILLLFYPLPFDQTGAGLFGVWGLMLSASGTVVLRRAWKVGKGLDHGG